MTFYQYEFPKEISCILRVLAVSARQAEVEGKADSMASYKQEEVRKELQTAVSLCVQNKTMTPERARVFHRSGETNTFV